MIKRNALPGIGISRALVLALLAVAFIVSTTSCSESNSSNTVSVFDDGNQDTSSLVGDSSSLLQVYSEMGESGMRVTYSPMSLLAFTNVEELERVYASLMACVGLSAASPPSILLSDDDSLFYVRDDGTDVQGYYDEATSLVTVYADDIDESTGNQYWWTRHGMIEYLINMHGLTPDSAISPFMDCHWAST